MQQRLAALSLFSALACTAVIIAPPAFCQERTLWQIGRFDQSSEEFGISFGFGPSTSMPADPVYRVGRSTDKDWVGFQPGSANALAGSRGHPFTVMFPLATAPRGLYTLTIGVLPYMPRRPDLRVEINGKYGIYYLRPKISYDLGNFPVAFIPQYSYQKLEIEVPTDALKRGENKLVITCVDDPPTPESSYGTVGVGISGIFYDALSFSVDPSRHLLQAEIRASATPTIFYRTTPDGLVEDVESIIRLNRRVPDGEVQLDVNGQHRSAKFSPTPDFGEQKFEFEIPEWHGAATGRLRVRAGGVRDFQLSLEPARKWTIFVVPHTHLDVGYTDYQGKVAEVQPRVLDQAADLIRRYPDFRFSMDASWNLEQLLQTRSKEKRDEILNLIREGKIAMPAEYCNLLTGYASLETLFRSLYFSKSVARSAGVPFDYSNITDVPSYTGSYPSVLASAGVRYFVAAGNNWRAPFILRGKENEESPFWWEGPDGQKVLFWYSRHYMQVQSLFGLPPVQSAVRDSLPVFLQAYDRPDYKPEVVLIYGTQVENTDLVSGTATFVQVWDQQYTFPKLKYSTFPEFCKYVDEHYGKDLATYKGDGGPYWEDGVGSDAYYVSEDRANEDRALSADILSSVTHSLDPDLNPPKELELDIWRNIILFAEHTWTSWNSITQPDHIETVKQLEVKDSRATTARLEINDLVDRSMSQLADQIHVPAHTLVVFNSLSWQRDALVETDLFDHAIVTDLATGANVPLEVLWAKENFLHVRFLARDLPPVGYKCYRVTFPEPEPVASPAPEPTRERVVENPFYRITLDAESGAVAGIFDKHLSREIVDVHSPYKFDQYLYVSGGDGNTQIMRPISAWPPAKLTVHSAADGQLVGIAKTPFGQSIRLRSHCVNTPEIDTEILLFDNSKKIEFIDRVKKQSVTSKEGVYFAFPVASQVPQFVYATQDEWIDPRHDLMKGASLEWFTVQKWMASRDSGITVGIIPVDAPLASFGDVNRGTWPTEFRPASSTIFSYVMNNYWDTNYRAAQGGDFTFRYVVTSSAALDPLALARLGWEATRPVEVDYVMDQDKVGNPPRPLPAEGASFLQVDQAGVMLLDWKAAEDERGTILRFQEVAGRDVTAAVTLPRALLKSANLCNAVEDDLDPLQISGNAFRLKFRAHEILTIRVQ